MKTNNHHQIIIIGSGPAGLTAAIYAARANLKPILIAGNKPGGQLMGTTAIENWPGALHTTGPALMIDMQTQVKALDVPILDQTALQVDLQNKPFVIKTDQETLTTDTIIIATGATPNTLKCPGEDQFWGKGVSTCVTCDGAFYHKKNVVVVGGGDSSMESASFLHRNGNFVTIVHITDTLTASHAMQQRIFNPDGSCKERINIIYSSTVTAINGTALAGTNTISSVTITNQITKKESTIETEAVFLAIGLKPNTQLFENQLSLSKWGHIIAHDFVKTSVDGVFAAGDVIDPKYRQAIVSAGFGCIAALQAQAYLETLE